MSSNINVLIDPKYKRDTTPRQFEIRGEGVTRDSDGLWHWNGLTITDWLNTATWNGWLEVSGEAEEDRSAELTYVPARGENMSFTTFIIEAHQDEAISETPETGALVNTDDPIVTTSGDVRIESPVAGDTTKIVYIISDDVGGTVNNYINIQTVNLQLPDGTVIQLSNFNDDTSADPFAGAPNTYYFDRVNGQLVVYITPEMLGDYLCNIYFEDTDAAKLNIQPINLTVIETNNYYTNTRGGGGCDMGSGAGFFSAAAALLLAASALARKKRGR